MKKRICGFYTTSRIEQPNIIIKFAAIACVMATSYVPMSAHQKSLATELTEKNVSDLHNKLSDNNQATQQNRKISGRVVDQSGEPIIGASVKVKGRNSGTVTDLTGHFTLAVDNNDVVTVTYVGYESQQMIVGNNVNLNIKLKENNKVLDELVVVGYGTIKKKDLTGAVGVVKGTDLSSRHVMQVSTALQGMTSGVTVTRSNSAPGATASIKVRGITTISDSNPLVIIDGVAGDINQLNPNDIETMSVLKDAASASIYGSRAAAGVILITTKRAKQDEVSMSYNFEYGIEKPTMLPKYVNYQRFLEMTNELRYNDNNAGGWFQTYAEDQVTNWGTYNATDPDKYPIVDWQDATLKSSSNNQSHSLSISGGGKIVRSKASFRYDNSDGLYGDRNYQRYLVMSNNDFTVNKYLQAHLDINFRRTEAKTPNVNPFDWQYGKIPDIYALRWTNGMWGDVKDGGNICAMIDDGGDAKSWYNRIGGKAEIDLTPFDGFKLSAIISPNYNFNKYKTFRKRIPYTYASDANTVKGYMYGFYTTQLSESRNDTYDVTSQIFANYAKTFGDHDITAMVGYEDYYYFWENLSASRDQYELDSYPYLNLGPQDYRDNSGSAGEYAYRSFFGRLTYGYKNRYLFQANIRRDGSSRFYKDNRWATFPSFSAGWVISEEKFMKPITWLTHLKLRASWGKLGNERIGDYYPYQSTMAFGSALMMNAGAVTSVTTAAQSGYAVRDISWETTESWDFGIDATFLNNRLSLTADIYRKDTKDMLLALQIPKYIGFDNPNVNAGKMYTRGFDIQASWRDKIGEFSYSVGFNLSDFISKMGSLNGTEFIGDQIKKQGSEYNEWYGYLSDGLFLTQEDLAASPKLNNNIKVGDVKYKDISGPDGIPDGKISPEYDRVLLGGSLPRYTFGANFTAAYQGLDFAIMLQGVGSQNSRINSMMIEGLAANWCNYPAILDGNYWSAKNTDEQNAVAKYPRLTRSNSGSNLAMSDFWLFNGRYLRVKNITLGYTIPEKITQKLLMKTVRLYVSANDMFCFSGYPDGWDPEVGSNDYPITKSLLFGLSVNF